MNISVSFITLVIYSSLQLSPVVSFSPQLFTDGLYYGKSVRAMRKKTAFINESAASHCLISQILPKSSSSSWSFKKVVLSALPQDGGDLTSFLDGFKKKRKTDIKSVMSVNKSTLPVVSSSSSSSTTTTKSKPTTSSADWQPQPSTISSSSSSSSFFHDNLQSPSTNNNVIAKTNTTTTSSNTTTEPTAPSSVDVSTSPSTKPSNTSNTSPSCEGSGLMTPYQSSLIDPSRTYLAGTYNLLG